LGRTASKQAAEAALKAWSDVPGSSIQMTLNGTTDVRRYSCQENVILFNDPAKEVSDPVNCGGGALAVAGFCADVTKKKTINGVEFVKISGGSVLFNNGYSRCYF